MERKRRLKMVSSSDKITYERGVERIWRGGEWRGKRSSLT
jgi:hypothetical protein